VIALQQLLTELLARIPLDAGGPERGIAVAVTEVAVDVPIESRIAAGAELWISAPRGRLVTGFDPWQGRLHATFVGREP
jgi:hypothetical protein